MKMKIMTVGLLLNLILSSSYAGNTVESTAQAKAVMSNVYGSFVKVIPYIYSSSEKLGNLKDPKHKNDKDEFSY